MSAEQRHLDLLGGGHIQDGRGHRLLRFGGGDVASIVGAGFDVEQVIGGQRLGAIAAGNNDVPNLHILILGGKAGILQQVHILQRDLVGIFFILLNHLICLHIIISAGNKGILVGHHLDGNRLLQLGQVLLRLLGQPKDLLRCQVDADRITVGDVNGQQIDQHQCNYNQKGGRSRKQKIFFSSVHRLLWSVGFFFFHTVQPSFL